MKQNNIKGEWVRSSSTPKRDERLRTHDEFEASDLKKMLDNDWKVKSIKKVERPKRPRFHREPTPKRIKIQAGFVEIIVEFADWQAHGSVGQIVEKYY